MATMEDAKDVRLQHCSKVFRCCVLDLLENADSGVVDQNVERAEFSNCVIDQRFNLIVVSHVADETYCPALIALIEFFNGLVNLGLMSGSNADRDTFTPQRLSDRAANSFGTAGDDCSLVFEIHFKLKHPGRKRLSASASIHHRYLSER